MSAAQIAYVCGKTLGKPIAPAAAIESVFRMQYLAEFVCGPGRDVPNGVGAAARSLGVTETQSMGLGPRRTLRTDLMHAVAPAVPLVEG